MDDFIIALEGGRMLCADYFIYNRETKTFETDYSFSTKVITFVRILSLTSTVYLSLPSFDDLNLIVLFQTMESVSIYALSIVLFVANYYCQEYSVRTYTAIMELEKMLLELNVPQAKRFKSSLKRLIFLATAVFLVIVSSAYLFAAYNGTINLLQILVVSTAFVSFYKTMSFMIVFLILWYYYKTINKCLEKLCFDRNDKFCTVCHFNLTAPKENLCKRHLIK